MARPKPRTLPAITLPAVAIPLGLTIRPQLVLRSVRRDRRARWLPRRLRSVPPRRLRNLPPRLMRNLPPWLMRNLPPRLMRNLPPRLRTLATSPGTPARRQVLAARLRRLRTGLPATARPMRRPLIAGMVALAATTLLVLGIVVRRRRTAASRAEGTATVGDAGAARPPEAAPAWLRRFVSRRFNPAVVRLGLVGGRRSPWAYLEHIGRSSGSAYRTPVLPRISGDYACLPLPFGVDVDWARNVRTSGHCRLQLRGMVYELDEPALISAAEHPDLPAVLRDRMERRGRRYLRLHVLAAAPGTLDEPREAPPIVAEEAPTGVPPTTTATITDPG